MRGYGRSARQRAFTAAAAAEQGEGLWNAFLDWAMRTAYRPTGIERRSMDFDDVPTEKILEQIDGDKLVHMFEFLKIADELTYRRARYTISREDTNEFLVPMGLDIFDRIRDGTYPGRKHVEYRPKLGVFFVRASDILRSLEEANLPDDGGVSSNPVQFKRKGQDIFKVYPRHYYKKLMAVALALAEDHESWVMRSDEILPYDPPTIAA